jgi:hypothetical protein
MPILQRVTCPDDPRLMLEQRMCVSPVSKIVKGRITDPEPERRECDDPKCLSLTCGVPILGRPRDLALHVPL